MPELAEVEYFRKRWDRAARGETVCRVRLHPTARVFRGIDPQTLQRCLTRARLLESEARAKQILVRFSRGKWLGIHLGMSGELRVEPRGYARGKHDHFVLETARHSLVFSDPRMFGRVQFHRGANPPDWWTAIAPAVLSADFTVAAVAAFLRRRSRPPVKAVLLMQERFPGIGNWMADEILWRAALHPAHPAGSLRPAEIKTLWRECRRVCRMALRTIAGDGDRLPPDLNAGIPRTWLFLHRWQPGGRCPKTGGLLAHATIGGRTTCWSPARQRPQ
jgi:formamidopyrimidine-DNA glycosylase